MGESQETIYPAMAMQDMWHAAAASIENAFAAGVDACLMLPLARFICDEPALQDSLVSPESRFASPPRSRPTSPDAMCGEPSTRMYTALK
jgi:hypothetical protein